MNKYLEKLLYFVFGIVIGYIAWGHTLFLTIFAILIIFAYFFIEKRINFFALVFGYYLAASRGLFLGTIIYYNITTAGGVYFVAALLSSLAWIVFWGKTQKTKIAGFLAAQAILILPPVGLIAWVNPILVAGLITPKAGSTFGIAAGFFISFVFIYLIVYFINNARRRLDPFKAILYMLLIFVLFLGAAYYSSNNLVKNNSNILAINSNEEYETGTVSPIVDFQRQMKYSSQAEKNQKNFFLLPENALGFVTPANDLIWQNSSKTIFAGASFTALNDSYYNTVVIIENGKIEPVYKQRVPVPISMWQPWTNIGAKADIWGKGGFVHNGYKYGVLICYEQLIMLPWIQTMLHDPDTILAISNLWWAKDTSILKIQEQNIQLWALLFDKPFAFAYNL